MVCPQNEVWGISRSFLNSPAETSTSNPNVSSVPYQAHLVLYEVSQELYLAVHASQLPFIIQCGYFLKMGPMRCEMAKNSPENVSKPGWGGGCTYAKIVQKRSVVGTAGILQTQQPNQLCNAF